MIKEREVKMIQKYYVCDFCEDEIKDSTSIVLSKSGFPDKHFHNMRSGGDKGTVERTCFEIYEAEGLDS